VNIAFTSASARYVRLNITGNTGWPAGQLSDFQVFGAGVGSGPANAGDQPDVADVRADRGQQQQ